MFVLRHWKKCSVALLGAVAMGGLVAAEAPDKSTPSVSASSPVEAGRYLVRIGGCNDCHTLGYDQSGGNIPESQWLTGVPVGFQGPWGTTYPTNLRKFIQTFTADQWVQVMRARSARPPMPWPSMHAMSDQDLKAVYEFNKSLGPGGEATPAYVPPGQEVKTPFIVFVPQMPATQPAK